MEYILWINDIVVIHNDKEYDFLNEMYPDVKELYNLIWHLQHNSSANRIYRMNKINNIKEEIKVRLKCYGIPEYILFKKVDDSYIEPVSQTNLNISKKSTNLRNAEEEVVKEHLEQLKMTDINFLRKQIPIFKENIENNKNLTINI